MHRLQRLSRPVILPALLTAMLGGCAAPPPDNSRGANSNAANAASGGAQATPTPAADLRLALANSSAGAESRAEAVNAYVSGVEAKLQSLTRKEKELKPADLKGVTDANWSKLHGYFEGPALKRVKTYPAGNNRKTEEFYFFDDKLVYVFIEPQGAGKTGDDRGAKGERLYFGDEGLFAWYGEDGAAKKGAGGEFKNKGDKLRGEAANFRRLLE